MAAPLTPDDLMRAAQDPTYFFRPRQPSADQSLSALAPQEEDSLLSQLGQRAVGGLSYAGKVLGKTFGGRAIRGLLGGHPREVLSPLPFSDTLGVTDENDEVHGEDLAKQWGLLQGEGTKGTFEGRDLVGPALELALDPGTYLTGMGSGALTELGKGASQLSILPKSFAGRAAGLAASTPEAAALAGKVGQGVADVADRPLAGLLRFGMPFSDSGSVVGTGPVGQAIGGKLDALGGRLLYSKPGRALSALFDRDVNGLYGGEAQKAARQANEQLRTANAGIYGEKLETARKLDQAGVLDQGQALRSTFEGQASPLPGSPLAAIAGGVKGRLADQLKAENALGIPTHQLVDNLEPVPTQYFPSYRQPLPTDTRGFSSARKQTFDIHNPSMETREDFLKAIPGGRTQLDAMVQDAGLRQGTPLDAAAKLRNGYLNFDEQTWLDLLRDQPARQKEMAALELIDPKLRTPADTARIGELQTQSATLDTLKRKFDQSHKLASWVRGLDPAYVAEQRPFFQHPLEDYGQRLLHGAKSTTFANSIHDLVAQNAVSPLLGHTVPDGAVPLSDVLKNAGLTFNMEQQGGKMVGAEATQLDRLGKAMGMKAGDIQALGQQAGTQGSVLDHFYVPGDIARDATKFTRSYNSPEALEPFLHVLDSVTNLTKSAQTSLWPAYYARNLTQGAYMNWATGLGDPAYSELNPMKYVRPYLDAKVLREGGVIPDASKIPLFAQQGLTDEQATQKVADLMYSWLPNRRYDAKTVEWETGIGGTPGGHKFNLPGSQQESLGEILHGAIPRSKAEANPFNITGVGGANETRFAPVKAGSEVNQMIDDMNQGAAFIGALRQGYEPQAAAARTIGAHYDYSNLSQFERGVVRRVIPFYGFMRQNLPAIVKELAAHPGGKTASLTKVASALRPGQGDFVPDYIREGGLAIPAGRDEATDTQRFLTHFDLPPEAAFDPFATGPGGPARTMMGILGQTNPLIKGPLEFATGKQFYSGRDLADLQGPTGNTLLDQVIMNSPLSRFFTTGRTLLDERKGLGAKALNLVSPAKITDVDMAKAKSTEGKKIAEELLQGQEGVRHFQNLYVKPEDVGKLSPDQVLLLRLYKTEEARQQKAAKQKAKAA